MIQLEINVTKYGQKLWNEKCKIVERNERRPK